MLLKDTGMADNPKVDCRIDEFVTLFTKHQRQIHVYITGLVFDPEDAFDILQETNLAMWRSFASFESGTSFVAWARKVAFNRVLQYRESRRKSAALVDPYVLEPFAAAAADETDECSTGRMEALERCLGRLREGDRSLIEKRYRPGESVRKIAACMGRSENAVSQSLRRIRGQLKLCISKSLEQA